MSACEVERKNGIECDDGNFITTGDRCVDDTCAGREDPERARRTIACGREHACAIRDGGKVVCWGSNRQGQLGTTAPSPSVRATAVPGISDAREISAGRDHTCVLVEDGSVVCWGGDESGARPWLGRGPAAAGIAAIPDFIAQHVSAGSTSSCATVDGSVWCWGANEDGAVGVGNSDTPLLVPLLEGVHEVSIGSAKYNHACAIAGDDRAVHCWGRIPLGLGMLLDSVVPVAPAVTGPALQISAGASSTCVRLMTNEIKCWGFNSFGELGGGSTAPTADLVVVSGVVEPIYIAAGAQHHCAVLSKGELSCWGRNTNDQAGSCDASECPAAGVVPNVSEVSAVALGEGFTCFRRQDGEMFCWGANSAGQLGNDTLAPSATPTRVLYE